MRRPSVVEIVGIGIDTADKIRQFAETYKINYPVLVAVTLQPLNLLRGLGNRTGGLPYTVASWTQWEPWPSATWAP